MHSVKVKRTGALVDISTLWDLEGATTPGIHTGNDNIFLQFDINKPQFERIHSVDAFNQVCFYYN